MKLFFTTLTLLATNLIAINANEFALTNLKSVVTSNGHYVRQLKEEFSYNATNISKTTGFKWSNEKWIQVHTLDYTYDANGNLLSEIKTSSTTPTYIEQKNTFVYDSNNNFLSEEFFISDSATQLVGVGKHTYIYNPDQTMKEVIASSWDPRSASWYEDKHYKYEYDANLNQTLVEILNKRMDSFQWENESKTEKTFNTANILTEEVYYKGAATIWEKASKTTYELKANNAIDKKTTYTNNGQNQWINLHLYTYAYAGDNISSVSEQLWDGTKWVLHSKDDYMYAGGSVSSITSSMKKSDNTWVAYQEKSYITTSEVSSSEYYYLNPQGEKTGIEKTILISDNSSKLEENFVWGENEWVLAQRSTIDYNPDSQIDFLEKYTNEGEYLRSEFKYTGDGRIFTQTNFDWYQNMWARGRIIQYSYGDTITSIDNTTSTPAISIFTQQEAIVIESEAPIKNAKVYTMTGKLIHNGSDARINTSSWIKGAYIVSVTTRLDEHKSSKVLIK